jgi:hypothetical protein
MKLSEGSDFFGEPSSIAALSSLTGKSSSGGGVSSLITEPSGVGIWIWVEVEIPVPE